MKTAKILKIIFVVLLAAVIILVGVAMFFKLFAKKHIIDGPGMINTREGELTGLYYCCGGGMDGEYTMYRLTEQDDRTVLLEYEYTPPLVHETTVSESCVMPEGTLDPFRLICRDTRCLIDAAYGKEQKEQLLDAPSANITFYLGDDKIQMHDNYDYPANCNGVFSNVVTQLKQLLDTAQQ